MIQATVRLTVSLPLKLCQSWFCFTNGIHHCLCCPCEVKEFGCCVENFVDAIQMRSRLVWAMRIDNISGSSPPRHPRVYAPVFLGVTGAKVGPSEVVEGPYHVYCRSRSTPFAQKSQLSRLLSAADPSIRLSGRIQRTPSRERWRIYSE